MGPPAALVELAALRARIDRLADELPPAPRLGDRLAAATLGAAARGLPDAPRLQALERALDAAGLHALADARLLARATAGMGHLRSFTERLVPVHAELVGAVRRIERAARLRRLPAAADGERLRARHGRVVRVTRLVLAIAGHEEGDPFRPLLLPRVRPPPRDPRLAAASHLLERAAAELVDLSARRRDLEAAREVLLSIAETAERERLLELQLEVARLRAELPRPGAAPAFVDRLRARAHGQAPAALYAELRWLHAAAIRAGDEALAGSARQALDAALRGPLPPAGVQEAERALEALGAGPLTDALERAHPGLRASDAATRSSALLELSRQLVAGRWSIVPLAIGAARVFDAAEGDPDGAELSETRQVLAAHPPGELTFGTTRGLSELSRFVISDPRTILHDVASGRQLVERFARREAGLRRARRAAVRVYVADASASMRGLRARFRDALLCAALHDLWASRGEQVGALDALYLVRFNDAPGRLTRVVTAPEALEQIERLSRNHLASGGTDITAALEHACLAIRDARGHDRELARASVVLLTDGDDDVRLERVQEALAASSAGLRLSISVVSIQLQNPDLRALVEAQRKQGRRAFFRHVTDAELLQLGAPSDRAPGSLLPTAPLGDGVPDPAAVQATITRLEAAARGRVERRVGPSELERWLPSPHGRPALPIAAELLERLEALLAALEEVVALAPPERRSLESVELLQALLVASDVEVAVWLAVVAAPPERLAGRLARLRALAAPVHARASVRRATLAP